MRSSRPDSREVAELKQLKLAQPALASAVDMQLELLAVLSRCAEVLLQTAGLSGWLRGYCPICGWEPDFAVITHDGQRHLVCGRCLAQWLFDQLECPYCGNSDRTSLTSFATRDGQY